MLYPDYKEDEPMEASYQIVKPVAMEAPSGVDKGQREIVPTHKKVSAAMFYATSSLLIMFVNKIALTTYHFPSFNFLAVSQFCFTFVSLQMLRMVGKVKVAPLSYDVLRIMAPLVGVSLINVLTGLGGTQRVSLPMFTCLRRFSILFTMILEQRLLKTSFSKTIQYSVYLMIFGAFIAALCDLSFDLWGYIMIFVCNVTTALNGVIMKWVLSNSSLGKVSVLFHSSWMSILLMMCLLYTRPEEYTKVRQFGEWENSGFQMSFVLASLMGSILTYSTFLCTATNSALTTTVVGCLKNVLTTYLGMIFMADYIFSWSNFFGLNISIVGSLLYSYAEFVRKEEKIPSKSLDRSSKMGQVAAAAGGDGGVDEEINRLLDSQESAATQAVEMSSRRFRNNAVSPNQ